MPFENIGKDDIYRSEEWPSIKAALTPGNLHPNLLPPGATSPDFVLNRGRQQRVGTKMFTIEQFLSLLSPGRRTDRAQWNLYGTQRSKQHPEQVAEMLPEEWCPEDEPGGGEKRVRTKQKKGQRQLTCLIHEHQWDALWKYAEVKKGESLDGTGIWHQQRGGKHAHVFSSPVVSDAAGLARPRPGRQIGFSFLAAPPGG